MQYLVVSNVMRINLAPCTSWTSNHRTRVVGTPTCFQKGMIILILLRCLRLVYSNQGMPFAVPFLFHPCGSHPGGCDTSLAKRQDTKWSADDFGHNLGVAASGKKLPKDLSTQGQVFSCDTRKSVIEVLLCCGFQGSSAASESDLLDSWFKYKYGWGCFFK